MTLDQFIREVRFRAECDALAEAFGEVPEGVMEALKRGALWEQAYATVDNANAYVSIDFYQGGRVRAYHRPVGKEHGLFADSKEGDIHEAIYSLLPNLTETEATP